MKTQEHIDHFSTTLTKILEREIRLGNQIVETSKGWPKEETIIIFLRKPFIDNYKNDNIEYRNMDDPHYWKAAYFDKITNHILACKF
jgi:hypothetical protein